MNLIVTHLEGLMLSGFGSRQLGGVFEDVPDETAQTLMDIYPEHVREATADELAVWRSRLEAPPQEGKG